MSSGDRGEGVEPGTSAGTRSAAFRASVAAGAAVVVATPAVVATAAVVSAPAVVMGASAVEVVDGEPSSPPQPARMARNRRTAALSLVVLTAGTVAPQPCRAAQVLTPSPHRRTKPSASSWRNESAAS